MAPCGKPQGNAAYRIPVLIEYGSENSPHKQAMSRANKKSRIQPGLGFCQLLNSDLERVIVGIGKIQVAIVSLIVEKVKHPSGLA